MTRFMQRLRHFETAGLLAPLFFGPKERRLFAS